MKHFLPAVLLAAALSAALAAPAALAADAPAKAEKPADSLNAVATEVTGNIKFRPTPEAKWEVLKTDTALPVGSEVLAGPGGRARIQMGPSVFLILKPFSRITIAQLKLEKANNTDTLRATLAKQYGRVEFDVRDAGFKNDFKIASPNGVMAVKGTGGEHDNFGTDEWVVGVPTNKDHAITYENLVAGYKAFLSANEGVSTRLPSVDAFEELLRRLDPADSNTLFTLVANQTRGGQTNPMGLGEWEQIIQQAGSLGESPAVEQALENRGTRIIQGGGGGSTGGQ